MSKPKKLAVPEIKKVCGISTDVFRTIKAGSGSTVTFLDPDGSASNEELGRLNCDYTYYTDIKDISNTLESMVSDLKVRRSQKTAKPELYVVFNHAYDYFQNLEEEKLPLLTNLKALWDDGSKSGIYVVGISLNKLSAARSGDK